MVHLEEGTLQALLDGELADIPAREAERHLSGCRLCSAALEELRRASELVAGAFALLDRAPPRTAPALQPPTTRRSAWSTAPLRRAAVLLLTFAAAASATIPGSPVRDWIGERFAPAPAPLAVDEQVPPRSIAAGTGPVVSGVSVQPAGGRLRIVLNGAAPDLQVRALLTESRLGGVYAIGDSTTARFSTAQGLIEVNDAGSGELRVEIPYSAEAASLVIDGETYLMKEGAQLHLEVPARDSSAAEILFEVQP